MKRKAQPFDDRQYMLTGHYEIFWRRDTQIDNVAVHHHDYYELYYFIGGRINYSVEERNYSLLPGDVLLISPHELHHPYIIDQSVPYERIVIWMNKSFLQRISSRKTYLAACFDTKLPDHTNLLRPEQSEQRTLSMVIRTLLEENENTEFGGDLGTESTLIYLLIILNRMAMKVTERYEMTDRSNTLITEVVNHINDHYMEPLNLDKLSHMFFTSKYYLSHEFQRLVGTSVYRYLIQRRLLIAHNMIADGAAPTIAFSKSGYRDYANFFRAFKREYGASPREFYKASGSRSSGAGKKLPV